MAKVSINVAELEAAVGLVTRVIPVLGTAFSVLQSIWLRTNPGKTEADFLDYLDTASQANIDDSAAILRADGFIEGPPGTWKKP